MEAHNQWSSPKLGHERSGESTASVFFCFMMDGRRENDLKAIELLERLDISEQCKKTDIIPVFSDVCTVTSQNLIALFVPTSKPGHPMTMVCKLSDKKFGW